jgi:hypothetical protein
MIAKNRLARIGRHQASLVGSLTDITKKLDDLAVLDHGSVVGVARAALMSSYAYVAARNELASLVKLTERALMVANHCEQPEISALLSKAFVGATAARNELIKRRRNCVAAG